MPRRIVILHRWQVVLAFVAVTSAFVVMGVVLTFTINQIQRDRLTSCQRTYEGVREVFRPFFRPLKERTPKEMKDIRKFNTIVDGLKTGCTEQTGVK